jgi:hypothetical protein
MPPWKPSPYHVAHSHLLQSKLVTLGGPEVLLQYTSLAISRYFLKVAMITLQERSERISAPLLWLGVCLRYALSEQ